MHAMNSPRTPHNVTQPLPQTGAEIFPFPTPEGAVNTQTTPPPLQRSLGYRIRDLVGLNPIDERPVHVPPPSIHGNVVGMHLAQLQEWEATKQRTDRR